MITQGTHYTASQKKPKKAKLGNKPKKPNLGMSYVAYLERTGKSQ